MNLKMNCKIDLCFIRDCYSTFVTVSTEQHLELKLKALESTLATGFMMYTACWDEVWG